MNKNFSLVIVSSTMTDIRIYSEENSNNLSILSV